MKPKMTREGELRWSPTAWGKLLYFLHKGDTEVAGYGITETEDPLLVTDIKLVKQKCTEATFELDEEDSAVFMEEMDNRGLDPWQYSNILWHTHPGNCPNPSGTDEKNFDKNFSHPNWAIFFIIARGEETYCRIRHNTGPGVEAILKTDIDYSYEFDGINFKDLDKEYKEKVSEDLSYMKIDLSQSKNNQWQKHYHSMEEYYHDRGNIWDDYSVGRSSPQITGFDIDSIDSDDFDELTIDRDLEEITYWDNETQTYYVYLYDEDIFVDMESYDLQKKLIPYYQSPEPEWMNKIRKIAKNNFGEKQEIINGK